MRRELEPSQRRKRSPGKQLAGSHQKYLENEEYGIRETRRKDILRRRLLQTPVSGVAKQLSDRGGEGLWTLPRSLLVTLSQEQPPKWYSRGGANLDNTFKKFSGKGKQK